MKTYQLEPSNLSIHQPPYRHHLVLIKCVWNVSNVLYLIEKRVLRTRDGVGVVVVVVS